MKKLLGPNLTKYVNLLIERYPVLEICRQSLIDSYLVMEESFEGNHKLLVAGNGGSAADAEHIVGELMKRFKLPRPLPDELIKRLVTIDRDMGSHLASSLESGLTALPLVALEALSSAFLNDVDGLVVYAQQLLGFGRKGDVFLGISTSGNSQNILYASVVARALGIKVIGLTGAKGGKLASFSDVVIKVPEYETYRIQELHLPIYHCWCLMLEERFFGIDCKTNV